MNFWISRTVYNPERRGYGKIVEIWLKEKPFKNEWDQWDDHYKGAFLTMDADEFERYFGVRLQPGEMKEVKLVEV